MFGDVSDYWYIIYALVLGAGVVWLVWRLSTGRKFSRLERFVAAIAGALGMGLLFKLVGWHPTNAVLSFLPYLLGAAGGHGFVELINKGRSRPGDRAKRDDATTAGGG